MKNINVGIVGQSFGGHCFPKDFPAMIRYNHYVRSNRAWISMKGSAVNED